VSETFEPDLPSLNTQASGSRRREGFSLAFLLLTSDRNTKQSKEQFSEGRREIKTNFFGGKDRFMSEVRSEPNPRGRREIQLNNMEIH
jgi:hypothetical protein